MSADVPESMRAAFLPVAVLVGLLLAAVHWVGLAVGGALVGLAASSTRRGLAAGAGFGALAWAVFLGRQFVAGVGPGPDATQLVAVALVGAVVLATVGASVRVLTGSTGRARR
ncbi:MAG: hypothetical protein ABEJ59_03625 [Halanaeroarchaeum sp.]